MKHFDFRFNSLEVDNFCLFVYVGQWIVDYSFGYENSGFSSGLSLSILFSLKNFFSKQHL